MNKLLAEHLASSDGLVTTGRALTMGVSTRQLEGLLARGELERIHRGVYRATATPVTQRQRLIAGLLAAGEAAVVSHRSALATHGAPNFSCALVELTNRSTSMPIHDGLVVHRSVTLGPADIARLDRMWVTTKERTVIDACTVLHPVLVMRFVEHWLASRRMRLDHLHDTIDRLRPSPGAVALANALQRRELGAVVADSIAEHRLGELLLRSDIPAEHHVLVTTATGFTYELDWAYPDALVGLEMDGYGIHMRSVGAFDDDRFRRNELENEGWQILNFTARQVQRQPGRVVQQVRGALARRETHRHGA